MAFPVTEKIYRTDVFEVWRQKLNVYQDFLVYTQAAFGKDPSELRTSSKDVISAINELLDRINTTDKRLGKLETFPIWSVDLATSLNDFYNDTQSKIGDIRGNQSLRVTEQDGSQIDNLSRGVNRLNDISGNIHSLLTDNKLTLTSAINELYSFCDKSKALRTTSSTIVPALNEIYTFLGTTNQNDLTTGTSTVLESLNDINQRLVDNIALALSNESRITVNEKDIFLNRQSINDLSAALSDLSNQVGDIALLDTPVKTSVVNAIISLNRITVKNTDKWYTIDTTSSSKYPKASGGIDPQGVVGPIGETGGLSITHRGSDVFSTGINGFHNVYRAFEQTAYVGLGNINNATHIPSSLWYSVNLDSGTFYKNVNINGQLQLSQNGQTFTSYCTNKDSYNFSTTADSYVFDKCVFSKTCVGINDSKTYFDGMDYTENGQKLSSKYLMKIESINPRKVSGERLWYPKEDTGDNIFTYSDICGAVNAHTVSGILYANSISDYNLLNVSGIYHAISHVQVQDGYYIGLAGREGTQIIDGYGNSAFTSVTTPAANVNGPISGKKNSNSYSFNQLTSAYSFTTTAPQYTFDKQVVIDSASSVNVGQSGIYDKSIIENGQKLGDKYQAKTDDIDGRRITGPSLWTPKVSQVAYPLMNLTFASGNTIITIGDGLGDGTTANSILRSGNIQSLGFIDAANYKINGNVIIDASGNIIGGNQIISSSDRDLKKDIKQLSDVTEIVNSLKPSEYIFKSDVHSTKRYGLIAQEVMDVLPELVSVNSDTGYLGVNYMDLIPILLKNIQTLNEQVEFLTTALENQNK